MGVPYYASVDLKHLAVQVQPSKHVRGAPGGGLQDRRTWEGGNAWDCDRSTTWLWLGESHDVGTLWEHDCQACQTPNPKNGVSPRPCKHKLVECGPAAMQDNGDSTVSTAEHLNMRRADWHDAMGFLIRRQRATPRTSLPLPSCYHTSGDIIKRLGAVV